MLCRLNILVIWLSIALALPGSAATRADTQPRVIGSAEQVVGEVYGNSLLRRLRTGEDLHQNQKVATGAASAAAMRFRDHSRLTVGPDSEIVLDRFVYDPDTNANQGTINLVRGVLRFTSSAFDSGIGFATPSVAIGIRGTTIEILVDDEATEIVVQEGEIEVKSRAGRIVVRAGESITIARSGAIRSGSGRSLRLTQAIARMAALTGAPAGQQAAVQLAESASSPVAASRPESAPPNRAPRPASHTGKSSSANQAAVAQASADERAAVSGRDPQNLLYLELPYGRVIIEMRPDLAPRHVARIKQLVRSGFYDGLMFHAVLPGRFAMTGDPTGTGHGGSGTSLAAELSAERFQRGSVGMAHDHGRPDSADSQFFIALDKFPEIDSQYTLWGQVIYGMAHVERLHTGNPPPQPDRVVRMVLASDLAG